MVRLGLSGLDNPRSSEGINGLLNSYADDTFVEFVCDDITYLTKFETDTDSMGAKYYRMFFSFPENQTPKESIEYELLAYAFHYTSAFKTGCLELYYDGKRESLSSVSVDFIDPPDSKMEDVFVENEIKKDIERFIYTFNNFNELDVPLRYLLSGKPGLGKTAIIRAIISECSKTGIVIIPKQMNGADWLTFEFAKLFKPALICIDDVDLIYGKREDGIVRQNLNSFLTMLDGIIQNKFFLIATTNDKHLVDLAASRPGRFDEIIDFGDFDRKFYVDIINQQTDNKEIINLFDEGIYTFMESKKVTGAYIVNLMKQLKIMVKMNPGFSKDDLHNYLNRNFKGFYKSQVKENKNLGFGN